MSSYTPQRKFVPYVTYFLIGVCALIFVGGLLAGVPSMPDFAMNPVAIGVFGEQYRLVTAMFFHIGFIHIAFNMLVLFMLGPALESVLGHVRFVVLYLLAGIGGTVASFCFSSPGTMSVGASGAIFGLMGAVLVAGKRLQVDIKQVAILLGINLVISFIPGGNIDWRAHIGGLVVGAAVAWVFSGSLDPKPPARTTWNEDYMPALDAYGNPIAGYGSQFPDAYSSGTSSGASAKSAVSPDLIRQVLGCVLIFVVLAAAVYWRSAELTEIATNQFNRYHG